ncbi:UNVERIFIED_CONTAM: protein AE7-like 1, partial [Sesamum calycinum]
DIRDPEHPYSLEQLSVLSEESITVDEKLGRFSDNLYANNPALQHATVIGLCLKRETEGLFSSTFQGIITFLNLKMMDFLLVHESRLDSALYSAPILSKTCLLLSPAVNKQLNDKERVAAALENPNLRQLVDECLYSSEL